MSTFAYPQFTLTIIIVNLQKYSKRDVKVNEKKKLKLQVKPQNGQAEIKIF